MRVVTTCHKAGWEQYGQRCLDGLKKWPKEADFWWYTEGFSAEDRNNVQFMDNSALLKLQAFKAEHSHYRAPDWRYDVVRFANKSYAIHDALRDYRGLGVWMDADIITINRPPKGYIAGLLPADCYIALFQRDGMHSETGLWLVNCEHEAHAEFMDTYLDWYESGRFKGAHQWHDCVLLDATIRAFERAGRIKVHNLSGAASNTDHPMAVHPSAQYWDHCKGPKRKELGYSPERKAA